MQTFKDRVIDILESTKATDIVTIDLRDKATAGEYMIIASGSSSRQLVAIADKLSETLKPEYRDLVIKTEGRGQGDWVLIDLENVIVHLFRPEVRDFYALEKMWTGPAVMTPPSEKSPVSA